MVMLDLDTLKSDTGWAETSTGDRITAEQARRLACQAGIIPVVLGGKGEILDLGRTRRLFSPAQRKAMAVRDRTCTAEGCDIPAAWCEAHHFKQPWSEGRPDRPGRRQAPLLLPPPPRPRPHLGDQPPTQRIHLLPPADVRSCVFQRGVRTMTNTARVQPTVRVRIERWRRARELSGDQRAGSMVHRDVLGQRVAFLRRQAWRLVAGGLFLAIPPTFIAYIVDSAFVTGACVGGYVVGLPLLIGSLVVSGTGTASLSMGGDAERWTASGLRRARRRGWHLVNDVTLGRGNIDHVLVGPGGAFAVETKWTSAAPGTKYGRDFWARSVSQVESNARSLGLWTDLRKLGVEVRGVLVVWGPASRELSSEEPPLTHSGVLVVPGHALKNFVRELGTDVLSKVQVESAWEALNRQVDRRDAADARPRHGSAGDMVTRAFALVSAAVLAMSSPGVVLNLVPSGWAALTFVAITLGGATWLLRLRLFVPAAAGWVTGLVALIPIALTLAFN